MRKAMPFDGVRHIIFVHCRRVEDLYRLLSGQIVKFDSFHFYLYSLIPLKSRTILLFYSKFVKCHLNQGALQHVWN